MLSREDNETLVRTGAGTPMGELFRSYWIPVLLSEQFIARIIPAPSSPRFTQRRAKLMISLISPKT